MYAVTQIAKHITCSRTKTTAILKNVIGATSKEELINNLKTQKFSIIVDESTDKGCTKHLCLLARLIHGGEANDVFLDLVPVQEGSAQSLYDSVVKVFVDNGIPYKENMIGFASDGANVMMGAHNSLSSRLVTDVPNLFIMKCICHSFHLCASYACMSLPRAVEQMTRDIYNYFMSSPKRLSELKEFQDFVKVKPHKLLHPSQTRWLSLQAVVCRVLEQYDALILYFTDAALSERIMAAEKILHDLKDPTNKLYLQFLEFILPFFTDLNKMMQSERPKIHLMYDSVSVVCRTIMDCYIRRDHLQNTAVQDVQYRNPSHFLPLNEIYLGGKVTAAIAQNTHGLSRPSLEEFQKRCLNFLVESVSQICKRFPFRNAVFKQLRLIDSKVVLKKSEPSIAPLVSLLPGIIEENKLNEIDNEWRLLRNTDLEVAESIDTERLWQTIAEMKKGDGLQMFPQLSYFVSCVFCLPHSSAAAERIFSVVNSMKTKQRNSLSTKTLVG